MCVLNISHKMVSRWRTRQPTTLLERKKQINNTYNFNKQMKGKTLRQHSLLGKTAVSVLLKLFISGNKRFHTTDAPLRMSGTLFSNVNSMQSHDKPDT